MTELIYEAKQAVADAIYTYNKEFKQVDEMDKMLGLASEDPLKTTFAEILPKYANDFYKSIEGKGDNTRSRSALKRLTGLYCCHIIKYILDNYREESKETLEKLIEFVQPYAIKIVIACEAEAIPKPVAALEEMLYKCVTRFCGEFKK